MENKRPWYLSSSNAKNLSRTVKGFFTVGIVTAIVGAVEVFFGVSLLEADINAITDAFSQVIVAIGFLGGAIYGLFGAIMKVVNKFRD